MPFDLLAHTADILAWVAVLDHHNSPLKKDLGHDAEAGCFYPHPNEFHAPEGRQLIIRIVKGSAMIFAMIVQFVLPPGVLLC